MAHVERDIFINTTPEALFDYMGNPQNTPEWFEGVVETNAEHDHPVIGATIPQVYTAAGIRFEMSATVNEFDRPNYAVFGMDGMITGTFRWEYTPENGGTHVKAIVDYEMAGGALGKIADKLIVERMNISQLEKTLENLKRVMEQ